MEVLNEHFSVSIWPKSQLYYKANSWKTTITGITTKNVGMLLVLLKISLFVQEKIALSTPPTHPTKMADKSKDRSQFISTWMSSLAKKWKIREGAFRLTNKMEIVSVSTNILRR